MADVSAGERLKVFISYSRKDSASFSNELLAGLEVGGFAPFLDRHAKGQSRRGIPERGPDHDQNRRELVPENVLVRPAEWRRVAHLCEAPQDDRHRGRSG